MSTYQPPGGPPPGPPAYVPPQDPWAGGPEHGGLASMPTDPIPQQFDGYTPPTGADVWSQATVMHGADPGMEQRRGRGGLLAIIILSVLVLGGGGGYATYYFVKQHGEAANAAQSDLQRAKVNDCMVNLGTAEDPDMHLSACDAANAYKVVKVGRGDQVPRRPNNTVDADAAATAVCERGTFDNYYVFWDEEAPSQNVVLCLAVAKKS